MIPATVWKMYGAKRAWVWGLAQGAFCGFRGVGAAAASELITGKDAPRLIEDFLEARWNGIRPVLWGNQLREAELMRGIYAAALNIDGAVDHENK